MEVNRKPFLLIFAVFLTFIMLTDRLVIFNIFLTQRMIQFSNYCHNFDQPFSQKLKK